jgi:hypothetical protein
MERVQVAMAILRSFESELLSLSFESIVFFLRDIPARLTNDARLADSILIAAHKVCHFSLSLSLSLSLSRARARARAFFLCAVVSVLLTRGRGDVNRFNELNRVCLAHHLHVHVVT